MGRKKVPDEPYYPEVIRASHVCSSCQRLESIIVQAKKAVKSTQEKNDKLHAELDRYRWIPVSEGSPKDSEPVQVVEFMRIKEGYYNGGLKQYLVWGGNAWCYSNNVTHYRYIILPEPEQALESEVKK